MKRISLRCGDVFEIETNKGFAYARVVGTDDFGTMFELSKELSQESLADQEIEKNDFSVAQVVYLNVWAAKQGWRLRVRNKAGDSKIRPSFSGTPRTGWHVHFGDSTEKIDSKSYPYELMLQKGYVGRTLWLPRSVKAFYEDDKPLIWTVWP